MYDKSLFRIVAVLAPCVLFHSLGMDIFVSCLPNMQLTLNTSISRLQWILSIFMIATGAGQLFLGPLADKYGRRPIMLVSCAAFIVFSVWCAVVTTVDMLIIARLFQGIAACGTTVVTVTIIRDVFDDHSRPKAYSYMNAAIALAPMLAPAIGATLLLWFGSWRSSFYFLAGFGLLGFIIAWFELIETKPRCTKVIEPKILAKYYLEVISNSHFLTFVSCGITALTALFIFFSLAPMLLISDLGITEHVFSYFFGFNAIVYVIGTIACPRLCDRIGLMQTVQLGSACIVFGASIMVAWYFYLGLTVEGVIIPNAIITFGTGLIFGPCSSGALSPFKHIAGTASAAYGFLEYSVPGLIGAFALSFADGSTLPLGLTMLILGVVNLVILRVFTKFQVQHAKA